MAKNTQENAATENTSGESATPAEMPQTLLVALVAAVTTFSAEKQSELGKKVTKLDDEFTLETYAFGDWLGMAQSQYTVTMTNPAGVAEVRKAVQIRNDLFASVQVTQFRFWRVLQGKVTVLSGFSLSRINKLGQEVTIGLPANKLFTLSLNDFVPKVLQSENGAATNHVDMNYSPLVPTFDWQTMLELKPELRAIDGLQIVCTKTRVQITVDTREEWDKLDSYLQTLQTGGLIIAQNTCTLFDKIEGVVQSKTTTMDISLVRKFVIGALEANRVVVVLAVVHPTVAA